jgi:hypothetical protein
MRWWLVDRFVHIWEIMVGGIFLDTPYLNLFYKCLGLKCHLSSRIHVFLRNHDLITCGKNSVISGHVCARILDKNGLTFDTIVVGESTELASWSVTYPREEFIAVADVEKAKKGDKYPSFFRNCEKTSILTQFQRLACPFLINGLFSAGINFFATLYKWDESWPLYVNILVSIAFSSFYLTYICLMLLSGLFIRFSAFQMFGDKIGYSAYSFLRIWIDATPLMPLMHRFLYGTNIHLDTQQNNLMSIKPSEGRYITIGKGSTIPSSTIKVTKEHLTVIGEYSTVGYCSYIGQGLLSKMQVFYQH